MFAFGDKGNMCGIDGAGVPSLDDDIFEVVKNRLTQNHFNHCEESFKGEEIREAFFPDAPP